MEKFKVGDKVEVVEVYDNYKVGEVGTITSINEHFGNCPLYRINGDDRGASAYRFKKVEDSLYEDQWHLNDGKVEIPGDADKLEKSGSVVAFRKRKEKLLQFGDILLGKVSGTEYRFIKYSNTGISKDKYAVLLNEKDEIVQDVKLEHYTRK